MGFEQADTPTCNRCYWRQADGGGWTRMSTAQGCPVHEPTKPLPIEQCHTPGCTTPIVWALTNGLKHMPVEAEPVPDGTIRLWWDAGTLRCAVVRSNRDKFGKTLYRSHFATCREADKWRNRGGRPVYQ